MIRAVLSSRRQSLSKSSSTVGVHLAAIKALTRAVVMAGFMPAEVAAAMNDVRGAPRRGNRIGNWLTREQAQERFYSNPSSHASPISVCGRDTTE